MSTDVPSEVHEMIPAERRARIVELLEERRAVRVSVLSETLGVSEMTIRRDLEQLEQAGLLSRMHGGAILKRRMLEEPLYATNVRAHSEEKRRIAKAAARDHHARRDGLPQLRYHRRPGAQPRRPAAQGAHRHPQRRSAVHGAAQFAGRGAARRFLPLALEHTGRTAGDRSREHLPRQPLHPGRGRREPGGGRDHPEHRSRRRRARDGPPDSRRDHCAGRREQVRRHRRRRRLRHGQDRQHHRRRRRGQGRPRRDRAARASSRSSSDGRPGRRRPPGPQRSQYADWT